MDCKKCGKELYEMGCQLGVEMCDCPPAQMTAPRTLRELNASDGKYIDWIEQSAYDQLKDEYANVCKFATTAEQKLDAALKEVAFERALCNKASKTLEKTYKELTASQAEVERFKLLHDEEKSLRGMIEIERDEHFAKLAAAEKAHAEFCEQAQEKTDADFAIVREQNAALREENARLKSGDPYGDAHSIDKRAGAVTVLEKTQAKLTRAVEALKEVLHEGNLAAQAHWDSTDRMKDIAFQTLKEIEGE